MRVGGEERVIAAEDAGRYRDGLGVMPPAGLPDAFLEAVPDALRSIVARYARTTGPFHTAEPAGRYGLDRAALEAPLAALESEGALVRGELRPGGSGREWCDAEVVRRLRRASLATLRREIEPADPRALGRFLPDWQRVDRPGGARGADALREALGSLQGLALPPAQWEGEVFPRRVADYGPACAGRAGRAGRDRVGGRRAPAAWAAAGWRIYFREDAPLLGPAARRPGARGPGGRRAARRAGGRGELLGRPAGGGRGAARGGVHRPLGAGLGRARSPTTSGCPCGRPGACPPSRGRAPGRAAAWGAAGARRRRSRAAGRWPSACSPTPPRPTSAAGPWPSCWWSATAC